jgi:hypothetical protein
MLGNSHVEETIRVSFSELYCAIAMTYVGGQYNNPLIAICNVCKNLSGYEG